MLRMFSILIIPCLNTQTRTRIMITIKATLNIIIHSNAVYPLASRFSEHDRALFETDLIPFTVIILITHLVDHLNLTETPSKNLLKTSVQDI